MRKWMAVLAMVCLLSSLGLLRAQQNPKPEVVQPAQPLLVRAYPVEDLAVWSQNGKKFDPSILIALLKSNVLPDQWKENHRINSLPDQATLVVVTSPEAHEAIAEIIGHFRINKNK